MGLKSDIFSNLYAEHIVPESKNPYHFYVSKDPEKILKAYNPLCGDKFDIYMSNRKEGLSNSFYGFGCALSKASTSILLREIQGKNKSEAYELCHIFLENLENGNSQDFRNEQIKTLLELKNFEGRIDCIKLSWEAMLNYLKPLK